MSKTIGGWCSALCLLSACSVQEPVADVQADVLPALFPDYLDVTIPANIAPLRFRLSEPADEARLVLESSAGKWVLEADGMDFLIPRKKWKKWLQEARGETVRVKVMTCTDGRWTAYRSFGWHVSSDDLDPYLVYRLVEPGYELWNKMGIYQRDLTGFDEKALLVNSQFENNCMNCHTFNQRNPRQLLFHMRAKLGGTYFVTDGQVRKVNGKLSDRIQSLVYPYWHPSGRYVAFSTNTTRQAFHRSDRNRVEVYDLASDVLVYDIERHEALTDSCTASPAAFETFPAFSPDGATLYFCSADTFSMPTAFREVRYSLCSIGFDAEKRTFVPPVDTLYSSAAEGGSVSFPRVSPDGRFLVYTKAGYGNFSIWHKDADLYLLDLQTRQSHPLAAANSDDVESYHTWSSNSRWMVFSSRRMDGLHTRPYIVHIDSLGQASKPFLLPQASPGFYDNFRFSYNLPELVEGEVGLNRQQVLEAARQ